MDALLQSRAEELASEIASQARTAEDLNGLMRLMMKSALERMLDTEMDVHLGRKKLAVSKRSAGETPAASEPSLPPPSPGKRPPQPPQRAEPQDGARRPGRIDDRHTTGS